MEWVRVPFEVETNYAGWRLDRYLQEKLGRASRTLVQKLIRDRLEHDQPRKLKPATRLTPGLRFVLLRPALPEPAGLPDASQALAVLYDDGELLAINKPAGLPVHPTARYFEHTLTTMLGKHHRGPDGVRPDPAHRLDRETSGVLICGRGRAITSALGGQFARHDKAGLEKRYLALCEGALVQNALELRWPLALTGTHAVRIRMTVLDPSCPSCASYEDTPALNPDLKVVTAHTSVRCLKRLQNDHGEHFSLVECTLHTGRQHQIRAHLAHAGYPLVGDKIYGADETRFIRFVEDQQSDEDRAALRLSTHALHASSLSLIHPTTGKRLQLEAPLPEALAEFIGTLQELGLE